MSCCNEAKCRRRKPFIIRRGGLSGRVFLITEYKTSGEFIDATTKHDITDVLSEWLDIDASKPFLAVEPVGEHDRGQP